MRLQMSRSVAETIYRSLSNAYDADGRFGFELEIHPPDSEKHRADMVVHFNDPNLDNHDDLLIGVELKDWTGKIFKPLLMREYAGYKDQFDVFYMAANFFGGTVTRGLDNPHIGMVAARSDDRIYEHPRPRTPNERARSACIDDLGEQWTEERDFFVDHFPDLVRRITYVSA